MSHLDILLPFGLPPKEFANDLFRELNAPALTTLISRTQSTIPETAHQSFEEFSRALPHETWIASQFGLRAPMQISGSPPVALTTARQFGLPCDAGVWFIINPVHIHIARDHLVLTDPRQLVLKEQESRTLFDIAQPLFYEAGHTLLYGNANTWLVRADGWEKLQTSTPDVAQGHNVDIWMPKGEGEREWRKLQNEVQMHWHGHTLNIERELRGEKPVNSLWLWGATPATMHLTPAPYKETFNLSGWMESLGQFAKKSQQNCTAETVISAAPQHGLLLLDALLVPALNNDWSAWITSLTVLENDWFAPLLAALRSGQINQIELVATHHQDLSNFTVTKNSLRKFWRKPTFAPLLSYPS